LDEPLAWRTPPVLSAPGMTVNCVVPWLAISPVMLAAAPRPMPIVTSTAVTPMIMPSIVRMARILWEKILSRATLK
jgi:hypothetical protein